MAGSPSANVVGISGYSVNALTMLPKYLDGVIQSKSLSLKPNDNMVALQAEAKKLTQRASSLKATLSKTLKNGARL
jgi:hypothetical protein